MVGSIWRTICIFTALMRSKMNRIRQLTTWGLNSHSNKVAVKGFERKEPDEYKRQAGFDLGESLYCQRVYGPLVMELLCFT